MYNLVALLSLLLVSLCVVSSQPPVKTKTAYLAAPGGWQGNPNSIASYWLALYAMNWVNNRTDILPDVALNITFRDHATNGGNPGQTLLDAVDLVKDLNVTGFLGGAYTNDQQVIQYVASALKGMPHTCGFSSGALLSNKALYPTFVRLPLSDSSSIIALVNFCVMQGWKRIAAVITDSDYGTGNKEDLFKYAGLAGIDVFFVTVPTGTKNCTSQTTAIKNSGDRVIVPLLQYTEGYIFMWFANKAGLVGPGYVYLLTMYMILNIGHYQDQRVTGFNLNEIIPYFEGAIGFLPQGGTGPLYDELHAYWQEHPEIIPVNASTVIPYSWYMFDAVLTYAYALDNLIKNGTDFEHISHAMLVKEMFHLEFNGVTGFVHFEGGDNQGVINLYQFSKAAPQGNVTGFYDPDNQQFTLYAPLTYFGGTTTIPEDSTFVCPCENGGYCNANRTCVCPGHFSGKNCEVAAIYRSYNAAVSEGLGALVGLCVIFAFFSAIVLAVKWNQFLGHGPFYCGIIIFGVLLSYVAALTLLPRATDSLCIAFPWFLGVAFNLVYGCLFIKTWVLYGAFRKAAKMEKTDLTPFYILKIISLFLLIEIVLMIVWTVVDPPKAGYSKMLDNSYYYTCNSKNNTFWIIFLSYKGAWLVFGSILSFLTRNLAKEYNESKSIAYAIYNDIALLIIAIPLAIVLKDVPSGDLIIEVGMIILAFTFTMFILFFPIWWKIFYAHLDTIAGVQGTGSVSTTKTRSSNSSNSNSSNSGSGANSKGTTSATIYAV